MALRKRPFENVQEASALDKRAPTVGSITGFAGRSYQKQGAGTYGVEQWKKSRWQQLMENRGLNPQSNLLRTGGDSSGVTGYDPLRTKVPIPGGQGGERGTEKTGGGAYHDASLATQLFTKTTGVISNILGGPKEALTGAGIGTLAARLMDQSASSALNFGSKLAGNALTHPVGMAKTGSKILAAGLSEKMARPAFEKAIGTMREQYGDKLSNEDITAAAMQSPAMDEKQSELLAASQMDPAGGQMYTAIQQAKDLPTGVTGHIVRGAGKAYEAAKKKLVPENADVRDEGLVVGLGGASAGASSGVLARIERDATLLSGAQIGAGATDTTKGAAAEGLLGAGKGSIGQITETPFYETEGVGAIRQAEAAKRTASTSERNEVSEGGGSVPDAGDGRAEWAAGRGGFWMGPEGVRQGAKGIQQQKEVTKEQQKEVTKGREGGGGGGGGGGWK